METILDDLRESLAILQERIDNPNAHLGVTSDLKECWNAISNAINEIESLKIAQTPKLESIDSSIASCIKILEQELKKRHAVALNLDETNRMLDILASFKDDFEIMKGKK